MKYFVMIMILVFCHLAGLAQTAEKATVFGKITDGLTDEPIEFATIYIEKTNRAVESALDGTYRIEIPTYERVILVFSRIGYQETRARISPMSANSKRKIDVALAPTASDVVVEVTDSRINDAGIIQEDVTELKLIPSTTGNLESVLPHIALGTNSGTGGELSSQYNVRGGNYDENLVYVNDFEIYRPQLIRSGQQEGLTFPHIDLIRNLSFSSGGFEAKYGDKMSSVLDIKYKRPDSLRASVGLSFLGGSAHVEGSLKTDKEGYRKFRYLLGARYKTTRYLLGSLDVKGEYTPNFTDVQTYLTYDLNRDWQIGLLANYNRSEYQFVPTESSRALGLIDFALELFTVFEGQEIDDFTTAMGGVSATYLPDRKHNPYFLKWLVSTYQSDENERFDIIGHYLLGQIESDLGSDGFGDVVAVLGTGTQQQFVRNYLRSNVTNAEFKGGIELQLDDKGDRTASHFLQWGTRYQHERIDDQINEWERLDSAGYSLTYDTTQVLLRTVTKTQNDLSSNRLSAFIQNTYNIADSTKEMKISAGIRASYWDLNKELTISPRVQMLYKPVSYERDVSFRLAGGLYFQPPFYRELRNPEGRVNTDVKAQKSAHIVGGMTIDFYMGKNNPAKFRLIMEAYYKYLWDLVSYEVDNVRIRYSGLNDAKGYVTGLDVRLNGEFVPGAESWINLSFLRARERLEGVTHRKFDLQEGVDKVVNDVPRPTDRFMTLSMFFQDYLPKNENFKMHLNLSVGTGLPFGLLGNNREYRNTFRYNAYHRVDIGFSVQLWDRQWREKRSNHPLRFSRSSWLSLEVFNLLKVANTASNTWIKTITNVQYAIPNFLTSRRINLRLKMDF